MNNELVTIRDVLIFLIEYKYNIKVIQIHRYEAITIFCVGKNHISINISKYPIIVVILKDNNNYVRYLNSIDDIERVYNDIVCLIDHI